MAVPWPYNKKCQELSHIDAQSEVFWLIDKDLLNIYNYIYHINSSTYLWLFQSFSSRFGYFQSSFRCKLFHSMRYFFDNYQTYLTVCPPKAKDFESACEGLSVVSERERQYLHYVR